MHQITQQMVIYHQAELLEEARRLSGFQLPTLTPFMTRVTEAIGRRLDRHDGAGVSVTCATC